MFIVDQSTGEKINLLMKKKEITEFISSLPDNQKSTMLTKVNYIRRLADNFEKEIKTYVKGLDIEFDDLNSAFWENFKLSQVSRLVFDKDAFESASEEEKKIVNEAEKIKQKYMKNSSYIKFS
jgi:hypothetical protein